MEVYELSDKNFRIILSRELSELELNKIRKTMHEQQRSVKRKPSKKEIQEKSSLTWVKKLLM